MVMKYYKIVYGYGQEEYISITANKLPKAIALFMQGSGRTTFNTGAIRGQDIMRIVPDYHKALGWNKGYKITAEDSREIAPLEKEYDKTYDKAKLIAEYSIKQNTPEILSQNPQEVYLKIAPKVLS